MVVEGSGSSGSGNGGSGGGDIISTGDVSPVGQVSAVSSGTGGASLCQQACAALEANGCGDASCVSDCQHTYDVAGACTPLLDVMVACYINSTSMDCGTSLDCQDDVDKFVACFQSSNDCGSQDCGIGSDGSCSCSGTCDGSKLEVQCSPGDLTTFCVCIKDGKPISKCSAPISGPSTCDLMMGCCGSVFFP